MPLNMPSGSVSDISFGPAVVYMGPWKDPATTSPLVGVTPTYDVGYISEDGVSIEIASEKKNIMQGNPKLIEYSFVLQQSATINFTSIEWDFDNFARALGAGNTEYITGIGGSAAAVREQTEKYFQFGGNPTNTLVAIGIQHKMAVDAPVGKTGNTMNIYAWKCQSESGFSIPMGSDEHSFEMSFNVLRSSRDWSNKVLKTDQQLISIQRQSVALSNPFSATSYP